MNEQHVRDTKRNYDVIDDKAEEADQKEGANTTSMKEEDSLSDFKDD